MKSAIIVLGVLVVTANAYADTTAVSGQQQTNSSQATSGSQNAGQGNGNTIISNGAAIPDKTSVTERNVSAGVLGAFASSFNQYSCTYTKGGANVAVAGLSVTGELSANDVDYCVKGWTQAELNRQSTITDNPKTRAALQQASINVKCTLDDDIYRSMVAAGVPCQVKPKDMEDQTKAENVKYVPVYGKAQVDGE